MDFDKVVKLQKGTDNKFYEWSKLSGEGAKVDGT